MRLNQFFRYTLGLTLAGLLLVGCQTQTTESIAGSSSTTAVSIVSDNPTTSVLDSRPVGNSIMRFRGVDYELGHNRVVLRGLDTGSDSKAVSSRRPLLRRIRASVVDLIRRRGLERAGLSSCVGSSVAEFGAEGSSFEVFEDNGETLATLAPTDGAIRLLKRQDGDWVEVPVTAPQPLPGIEFVSFRHGAAPASTVVIQDARFMTVPDPSGDFVGMVALGDAVYGVSLERQGGPVSGFTVWRSEDGTKWAPVDLPDISPTACLGPISLPGTGV